MNADTTTKTKVAILGGGCGAMTAACYLTSTPELRAKYDVTVYQQGWRLGGKGATGRDQRTGYGDRIYEHGLHMWLGWYDNAFKMIQDVYAEWEKPAGCPFQSWTDAFAPQRMFTLQQDITKDGDTHWVTRNIQMPKLPGTPGEFNGIIDHLEYFGRVVEWLHDLYNDWILFVKEAEDVESKLAADLQALEAKLTRPSWINSMLRDLVQKADDILPDHPTTHPALLRARLAATRIRIGEGRIDRTEMGAMQGVAQDFLEEFQKWLHSPFARFIASLGDKAKWYWTMLDFATAVGIGMVDDVLPAGSDGIQAINDENFADWIARHGADPVTQWSAFTRAIYNLAFSFDGGVADRAHSKFEAGTALMVYLRMALGYKDAPMWRMLAGMGDTIFSPIYQVLKARGVKFQFFHRVTSLGLSADQKQVASITMDVQASIKGGAEYAPLYEPKWPDGKAFSCWPEQPLWDQIEDAAKWQAELTKAGLTWNSAWCNLKAGTTTLKQGVDFDQVVLGLSVASVKLVAGELSAANAAWHRMLDTLRTVETQAMQLWMQPKLADLGWVDGSTIMTTYQEPFDTWGEMSDVLPMENWQGSVKPQSLHYFCGPMQGPPEPPLGDPNYPANTDASVKNTALQWLGANTGHLWPKAVVTGTQALDFNKAVDPTNASGVARFDSQYWRANIDPSERYVASFPNTSIYRLRSEDTGFGNLFIAGDWAVSSVNGGCVEAAVESGMAASRAICGIPVKIPNYPET